MEKANRIKKRKEFEDIIASSVSLKTKRFVVYFRENKSGRLRVGLSVSRKNGNAVRRNKIKRQVRAMVGRNANMNKPLDVIIIIRTSYDVKAFHDEEAELASSLKKIGDQN
jgi:ribonuclease P protein component